jgi:Lar family restriction alleviation protein
MTDDLLLPCPFCGCTNIKVSADKKTNENGHVWCDNDDCEAGMYGDTREEAIVRWNKRVK